ncbi:hypothetical protein L1987_42785 [Smallanthus sonchifolius]|uniref:Uncharacterized protein n=1 Tax=Smallanthus sonchifolius TaxID=185202 RepID=A0ACB9GJB3_9ASTR|nr:hypothetical protein L1987_42785 [Smallanthus sonchifolius]
MREEIEQENESPRIKSEKYEKSVSRGTREAHKKSLARSSIPTRLEIDQRRFWGRGDQLKRKAEDFASGFVRFNVLVTNTSEYMKKSIKRMKAQGSKVKNVKISISRSDLVWLISIPCVDCGCLPVLVTNTSEYVKKSNKRMKAQGSKVKIVKNQYLAVREKPRRKVSRYAKKLREEPDYFGPRGTRRAGPCSIAVLVTNTSEYVKKSSKRMKAQGSKVKIVKNQYLAVREKPRRKVSRYVKKLREEPDYFGPRGTRRAGPCSIAVLVTNTSEYVKKSSKRMKAQGSKVKTMKNQYLAVREKPRRKVSRYAKKLREEPDYFGPRGTRRAGPCSIAAKTLILPRSDLVWLISIPCVDCGCLPV